MRTGIIALRIGSFTAFFWVLIWGDTKDLGQRRHSTELAFDLLRRIGHDDLMTRVARIEMLGNPDKQTDKQTSETERLMMGGP